MIECGGIPCNALVWHVFTCAEYVSVAPMVRDIAPPPPEKPEISAATQLLNGYAPPPKVDTSGKR